MPFVFGRSRSFHTYSQVSNFSNPVALTQDSSRVQGYWMCLNSNLLSYDSTVCSIFKPPPKMMDPRNKHQFLKAHLSAVIFSNVLISHVKFCLAESHIECQKPIMLNFLILTYETSVCILLDNFKTVILLLHYIHCLIKRCDFKSISVYLSLLCMLLYFRE